MKYAINIPNFGNQYSNPNILAELASEAEQAGWDGFFLWDHMIGETDWKVPMVDPWVALSATAMKTKRIKIGTMITPLPRRRPWKLARETVSLDHLSNGRVILGIGLGTPLEEFSVFEEDADPKMRAKKLDKGLDILVGLWSGKEFSYSGKYFKLDKMTFLPKPVQSPRIPIWIAGRWPNKPPFRRAARWNGVVPIKKSWPNDLTPNDVKEIVTYTNKYRTNPKAEPFDVMIEGNTVVRNLPI